MNRTRDFRRHQDRKHKKEAIERVKQYDFYQYNNPFAKGNIGVLPAPWKDPGFVGRFAVTPHPCSSCCGNPRRYEGDTRKEILNYYDF